MSASWMAKVPRLVHLTTEDAWEGIRTMGLRPTAWLVQRAENLSDSAQDRLLRKRRAESVWITVDGMRVRLRDQQPLSPSWSEQVVDEADASEYLATLNEFVFLFPVDQDLVGSGLDRFRRKYSTDTLILEFDTAELVERLGLYGHVRLVEGNPGATSYDPAVKHLSTSRWARPEEWLQEHPYGRVPDEILIRSGLPVDLLNDLLVAVHELDHDSHTVERTSP